MLAFFVIYSMLSHWLWVLFFVDKTHSPFLMSPWRGTNLENHLGPSLSHPLLLGRIFLINQVGKNELRTLVSNPSYFFLEPAGLPTGRFLVLFSSLRGECDRADSVPASGFCCFGGAGVMYYWRDGYISRSMWPHLSHVVQIGLSESKEMLISLPDSSAYLSADWKHERERNVI